jgi:hypothetical protein
MPFGFADTGIRCGQCGHFLNVISQAIPALPDPFPVTCPYCGTSARYPKSAICSDMPGVAGWAPIVIALIGIILLLGLFATRAHSAETGDASVHARREDCAVIAALGKAKLGWGAHAPESLLSHDSFGQDCDWTKLGIAGPSIAPDSNSPYYQGPALEFFERFIQAGWHGGHRVWHSGKCGAEFLFRRRL